jgi:MFS family permease
MTPQNKVRGNIALALLAGCAIRTYFALKYPVTDSGDAPFYIELAWNWLKNGVYGFPVNGVLTPVDMRVPGYPAFLAAVFSFAGQSTRAAMLAQVALDLVTCLVIALIAARLAGGVAADSVTRRRVFIAGVWLAALCPFTANYTAVVLTETLVIFLTAVAILVLMQTELGSGRFGVLAAEGDSGVWRGVLRDPFFLGGIVVGFGTLVRPETPLLIISAGLVLVARWWRSADWMKLVRAGVLMGVGVLLPLVPWAARNWFTLNHDVQFLAPRYSELPGEYTPLGFTAWTNTWLWRYRDVYLTQWKVNSEEISMDNIPTYAFDSEDERQKMSDILDEYNDVLTIDPALDAKFRAVASERTARHPLRTYVTVPLKRTLALWFTPRTELLPSSGKLWPVRSEWEDDRPDFLVTLGFTTVNGVYVLLAIVGAWIARRRPGLAFLLVFCVVRTFFFAKFVETPEPRYVLECFPAVIAIASQTFARSHPSAQESI